MRKASKFVTLSAPPWLSRHQAWIYSQMYPEGWRVSKTELKQMPTHPDRDIHIPK